MNLQGWTVQVAMRLRTDGRDPVPVDSSRGHVAAQSATAAAWSKAWKGFTPRAETRDPDDPVPRVAWRRDDTSFDPDTLETALSSASRTGAARILARLERRRLSLLARDGVGRDFEHAHEDARKLAAAAGTGRPVYVVDDRGSEILRLNTSRPMDPGSPVAWLGIGDPPRAMRRSRPSASAVLAAHRYYETPAFAALAGRTFVTCEAHEIGACIHAMSREGHSRAFLKSTVSKRGTWSVGIPRGCTPETGASAAMSAVGQAILHQVETAAWPGWMVQDHLDFSREYRFFVVGHAIVRGVPVRRGDTVYDGESRGRLDVRTCAARTVGHAGTDRPGVARLARAARRYVSLNREGTPALADYVLDMGLDREGTALPVEVNALSQAGLYSCDPSALLGALLTVTEADLAPPPSFRLRSWETAPRAATGNIPVVEMAANDDMAGHGRETLP